MNHETDRIAGAARIDAMSFALAGLALAGTLWLHLLSALFSGLLVYQVVHVLAPLLQKRLFSERSRLAAVVVLASAIVAALGLAIFGVVAFFRSDAGSLAALLQRMADIIDGARNALPPWIVERLPGDVAELREALTAWLRTHAPEIQIWGTAAGRVSFHVAVGLVIGAMVSLREVVAEPTHGPLAAALIERTRLVGDAFRRVVFAQMRISAINTVFTALYLGVLLPGFGVKLPLTATLVAVTFVAGLLPVIGNVISNTIIVVVSLSHSPGVAGVSLAYLVVIHKLEYFLNARIIGSQIRARAWEMLLAMLVMEAGFGLAGAVAAPVYYAWLKQELADRGWI